MIVLCPYCRGPAELCTGNVIYPHRDDLAHKLFWRCGPCQAWVGCHPHTNRPLGRLANTELRRLKQHVHRVFDPLWRSGEMKRSEAYRWLADKMGVPRMECHIGMFTPDQCRKAICLIENRGTDWETG